MDRMLQNVLDQAPDAILVADGRGEIRYANRHVKNLFGYAPEELTGQNIKMLIHYQLWEAHDRHLEKLRNSAPVSIFGLRREVFGVHRDGRELLLELHLNPLVGESEPMYIATLSDATGRKRKELEYEVLREQLRVQNERIQQLLDMAGSTKRARNQFLARVHDEIRTPLTRLLADAENLKSTSPEIRADRDPQASVHDFARRLLAMIDQLIGLPNGESDAIDSEHVAERVVDALSHAERMIQSSRE